jgi:hypothetical protein
MVFQSQRLDRLPEPASTVGKDLILSAFTVHLEKANASCTGLRQHVWQSYSFNFNCRRILILAAIEGVPARFLLEIKRGQTAFGGG